MYTFEWLSPDGGNEGGGGTADTAGTGTVPDKSQANPAAGTTPTTFTQEQVDKIVGERAKRAEESAVTALLKSLSVENPDALKVLVEAARETEANKLSEAEKARKRIEALEASAEKAKAEAKAAIEAANEKLLRSQVLLTAQAIGFIEPADAVLYLDRTKITQDDAGNFKGIEEMLKEIAKAKPHLVKPSAGSTRGTPSTPHGEPKPAPEASDEDAKEFAAVYGVNPKYIPVQKK